MKRILIIEDEQQILNLLKLELSSEGYDIDTAIDGKTGLWKIECGPYDLILLDIMISKFSGLEIYRMARKISDIPILIITARDQISGNMPELDIETVYFPAESFSMEKLLKRINCVLKNSS